MINHQFFWGVYDFQTNPYSLKHVLAVAGADANSKLLLAASSVNRRASTWGTTHQQPCFQWATSLAAFQIALALRLVPDRLLWLLSMTFL